MHRVLKAFKVLLVHKVHKVSKERRGFKVM